jgi:hypothetical protein
LATFLIGGSRLRCSLGLRLGLRFGRHELHVERCAHKVHEAYRAQ